MRTLATPTYRFMNANEVEPHGWLLRQLKTEASGLPGNLDLMWRDVRDSKWIGGDAEGWERVPYWLDGFIPLAYLLKDETMIARGKRYVKAILKGQKEDGWLCPCTDEERPGYDMWALLLISKVLIGYAECCPEDADEVENTLLRAFHQADGHLRQYPLFNWGKYRWFEGLIAVYWLYTRTKEAWLLDFATLLHDQGRDYKALIENEFDAFKEPERKWLWDTHIVNLSMAIKSEALWSLCTSAQPDDQFCEKMYETLSRYHGMPTGHFTGDECLAGRSPIAGTELCGVVEHMYSSEWILALSGNPIWGDRLERLTFNALPATTTPDMWRHQYDQQTNQIACAPLMGTVPFGTNGPESNVFGLEPNFGCCTANLPQGWPKFALSAFMVNKDTLFSAVPTPMTVCTIMNGVSTQVTCDTCYPFNDDITYTITTEKGTRFTMAIRIPATAKNATVNGKNVPTGEICRIEKEWNGTSVISVHLDFDIILNSVGYRDLVCANRGPLLFALPIQSNQVQVEYVRNGVERQHPFHDEYNYPVSPFGYAFTDQPMTLCRATSTNDAGTVFDEKNIPLTIKTLLIPIDWGYEDDMTLVAASYPHSQEPQGEAQEATLIPYGFTCLRMTAMPKI